MRTVARLAHLLALVVSPSLAAAQERAPVFTSRLGIAQPEGGPTMPSLHMGINREGAGTTEAAVWNYRLRAALNVVSKADRNPDDSYIEGALGYRWLLDKGKLPDTLTETSELKSTYAMFGVYVDGRYETNQSLNEQLGSGQVRAMLTHLAFDGPWLLVPQVQVAWGLTRAVNSEVRDVLGLDASWNTRFEIEALWRVSFGRFVKGSLEHLWLFGELRRFNTSGLETPLESAGFSKGSHVALRAEYDVKLWKARGLYLQWARGRLPSEPALVSTWKLGLKG